MLVVHRRSRERRSGDRPSHVPELVQQRPGGNAVTREPEHQLAAPRPHYQAFDVDPGVPLEPDRPLDDRAEEPPLRVAAVRTQAALADVDDLVRVLADDQEGA